MINGLIIYENDDPIHNIVLLVESPKIQWRGAAGMADGVNELMTPDHKFKIASITKTFTATIILQLIEEGMLNFNNTLADYLDNSNVILDSLVILNGISYGREITIKQLLNHTSSIRDYMEDERFIPNILENPSKQWSPKNIMEKYYEYNMNHKTYYPPGTDFDYSDVNYVLLAMIVEEVTGISFQQSLRQRIFDPLKMENSYLEFYEEPRGNNPFSHAYFSTVDINLDVNTSFDWGGGGIVSTIEELNIFFRALLNGKLFKKQSTLTQMLEEANKGRGGMDYDYGLGIQKRKIHDLTFYGHGGAYDCDVYYCPEKNISVCMSLNQMNTHGKRYELLFKAIEMAM
ncbi:serine hydrolase domain-containing protein [Candidatus Neomarinimicrobiota bacterium]